ncbi:hypothetical protein PESHB5_11510 [Pediococcus parvulus]|nr:hypothetical protein PPA04_16130 [Pediococcus parvulus]GHC14723.1 hypothetical protein GCM10008912_17960 [Pediococcus parvulus]
MVYKISPAQLFLKPVKKVDKVTIHKKSKILIVGEILEKANAAARTVTPVILKNIGVEILLVKRSKTRKLNMKINNMTKS